MPEPNILSRFVRDGAQGVLGLADRHGAARLELACAKAIAVGDPTYRTIKGILAAGLEADPPPPTTGDGGAAAFLHGPSRLFMNVVAMPNPDTATSNTATSNTATSNTATSNTAIMNAAITNGESGEGVSA